MSNLIEGWDVLPDDKFGYNDYCHLAATDDVEFGKFKQNKFYRTILEHVLYEEGMHYLNDTSDEVLSKLEAIKANDWLGSPYTSEYSKVGNISTTTLRYMKTATDILKDFDLNGKKIVEIGGGYGGQCFVLSNFFDFESYTILDLDGPAALQNRYLKTLQVDNARATTLAEYVPKDIDMIISNYAFSELSKNLQNEYFDKVISRSKSGYFQVNPFGDFGKDSLSQVEFVEKFSIFNGEVSEDHPMCLTYPEYFIYMFNKTKK